MLLENSIGEILSKEGKNFIEPRNIGATIDSIAPNSEAIKAGFLIKDSIVSVNGKQIAFFDEMSAELLKHKSKNIPVVVYRNQKLDTINTGVSKEGTLGVIIARKIKTDFLITKKMSIGEAFPAAVKESWALLVYNVKSFKLILRPDTGAYKQVKSPIGIARVLPDTWNWEFIWNFTALFSIGLAFMNLLPIPGLDGGHALFTIVEMITGKTLNDKVAGYVQTAGMIILLTLMALTFGKDIFQLVADKFL